MTQALSTPTDLEILQRYIDLDIRHAFAVPCSITDTWTHFACDAAKQGLWSFNLTNHEGNLAGLAAGVFLATGQPALIQLQNSGLPSIGDGLISMANRRVCGIPLVLLVTHRGNDIPQ
ncbi:MAG TPA: thiamine pyrophosphate-binding protein [Coleofasciculaceae cyanobacterium]